MIEIRTTLDQLQVSFSTRIIEGSWTMDKIVFQIAFFVGFSLLVNSMQEEFTIWRSDRSPTDLFKMPDSVCRAANWTDYCGKVHMSYAAKRTPCSCLCGYKNSFLYKAGKWECVPDKIMMKREGRTTNSIWVLKSFSTWHTSIHPFKTKFLKLGINLLCCCVFLHIFVRKGASTW